VLSAQPIAAPDIGAFWSQLPPSESPFESAVRGGARADRLGFAFAAGYEAALWRLLPDRDRSKLAALCATERGGAHPRAIETKLIGRALTGDKTFVTLADRAEELYVLASAGADGDRAKLVFVRVPARARGVALTMLPSAPFVPEIPHASVHFDAVTDVEVLAGDGWNDYVRPFRTIEDIHVHAAVIAYLIACARRYGWPRESIARGMAILSSLASLSIADASDPAAHVALGGAIDLSRSLVGDLEARWDNVSDEGDRWRRDRMLLEVAGKARSLRLEKAWSALS
jgi:acyl-CoA dehydrogenase